MNNLEGQTFAGYEIVAKLGEGGMGSVWRARQPMLNRLVALKMMSPNLSGDPAFVARFIREASAAANLNHPNMVQVYTAGENDKIYYIAMEFVEGESLRIRLDRMGRIPPQEAVAITVYVAQALQYAWNKAHLIHRDIKPDNIFLSNAGEVKVGDLGLAKSVGGETTDMTQTGMLMGSPHYISPEQAQGAKDIDFRADIYSLGCTLYHMLTGKTPYQGDSAMAVVMKHVNEPAPAIFRVWPACPMPLGRLVGKMVAKHRHERHQSYEDLVADLMQIHEKLRQSESVAPVATTPAPASGAAVADTVPKAKARQTDAGVTMQAKVGNRTLIYAAAGVCAAVALAGVLWWAPWKSGEEARGKGQAEIGSESRLQAESVPTRAAKAGTPTAAASEPPRQETAAAITPPAPPSPTADAGWQNAVNLLPLIDPQKDAVVGMWTVDKGELASDGTAMARLELPYEPPEEYDFRISFTRLEGQEGVAQILTKSGNPFAWCIGFVKNTIAAFGMINGLVGNSPRNPTRIRRDAWIENKRPYTMTITVRNDGLKALLNEELISQWKTDCSDMGLFHEWRLRDPKRLGVGAPQSRVLFHRIEVREVTGKGKFTRSDPSADSAIRVPQSAIPSAAAPFDAAQARQHQEVWARHLGVPVEMTNSIGMKFVLIPPGEFDMGSSAQSVAFELEEGRRTKPPVHKFYIDRVLTEKPQRRVKITKPFYLGVCEVTQGEYQTITGGNPSAFSATGSRKNVSQIAGTDTSRHPVEMVSWDEAKQFLGQMSNLPAESSARYSYRLPTEAEWEHACRAGTTTRWWFGSDAASLPSCAWFKENSGGATHPVGQTRPNPWGLFDMPGNVFEWCSDRCNEGAYEPSETTDPQGPADGRFHITRGGCYERYALSTRSAYRGVAGGSPWPVRSDFMGLRVVCEVAARRQIPTAAPTPPTPTSVTPVQPADGFQPLFNGRDLTGWEGRPEFWSVQDGAIYGKTTQETPAKRNTFLVCTAGEFGDFELRAQFKLTAGDEKGVVNSGVQYRSRIVDKEYFMLSGYQADLGFMGKKNLSGGFWEEAGRNILTEPGQRVVLREGASPKSPQKAIEFLGSANDIMASYKQDDWNDLVIIAAGNRLQHYLNGKLVVDVTDETAAAAKTGTLALQIKSGPPMQVWFRNLRIKKLAPDGQPVAPSVQDSASSPALKLLGAAYTNAIGAEMVFIPPGEFMLGSTLEERQWAKAETAKEREGDQPRRTRIKNGFWLGRTEVTVGQWKRFVAATGYKTDAEKNGYVDFVVPKGGTWGRGNGLSWRDPGHGAPPRDDHPVCAVSWNDAMVFCRWLTEQERNAGRLPASHVVRLPTEAEWEYACRAGTQTRFWWGDVAEDGQGRLNGTGEGDGFYFAAPVDHYGQRGRNTFGLADMLGNVYEWCLDDCDMRQANEDCYKGNPGARVLRGGAFNRPYGSLRCATRLSNSPSHSSYSDGFRVAVGVDVSGTPTDVAAVLPASDAAFIKETAALPPVQQVVRVMAKLKELNPQFDGKETHKIEGGAVTELAFSTVGVTDISPVRALKQLKKLTVAPWVANQKGSLADLSPLKDLPLAWLYCQNNPISDISPLRGLPLTVLGCGGTQVSDLASLAGMKLTVLSINDTSVSDLSPLSGMPLTVLWCNNTSVTDLAPMRSSPLQELRCDFQPQRDADTLRGIPTLRKINDQAAVMLKQAAAAAGGDIRVLIVTGVDIPSHDWRATGPAIQDELQKDSRMKVEILNDAYRLDSTDLTKFHAVLLNFYTHNKPDPNEQARENLKNFVNRGGGLVIFHSTCGSFRDWPEFRDLAGKIMGQGKLAYDKFGPMRVKIANANHPITRGMQPYETTDELYAFLTGRKPVEVLATAHAQSTGSDEPMAFVLTYGKGRVFHFVLGHALESIRNAGTAELLRRGTAWTASAATATSQLSNASPAQSIGFQPLFNGRDLTGWTPIRTTGADDEVHRPAAGGWITRSGELVCITDQSGWLRSERQYGNFVLQLEFKLRSDGNSGVYVRSPAEGHLSRVGTEIQIVDPNYKGRADKFPSNKVTGAIFGVVGTANPPLRPMGEWNSMEIRCDGDNIEVALNGKRTAAANVNQESALRERPRSGYIGISNWHGEAKGVAFRNIQIRELLARPAGQ